MSSVFSIRLLEADANRRGDLFGRLMVDLFLALGYDKARLNVHKSGRELDIIAQHRTEARVAVAECKATKKAIGGDDLNKFDGVLGRERRKNRDLETQGYFISLGGFSETALQQELDDAESRFITLDAHAAVEEMINGRILVPHATAAATAGALAGGLELDPDFELLAHERGWIWCIYFRKGMARVAFALVHAGGAALGAEVAAEVIAADATVDGPLSALKLLAPPLSSVDTANARSEYFAYLEREFGSITLEGLPADSEVGSQRIRLENLYVPLHVEAVHIEGSRTTVEPDSQGDEREVSTREPVADVLARTPRMAILAAPGAGKSTLLKRLAVAYAFPERHSAAADGLPDRPWLPLIMRCRHLERPGTTTILDALAAIPDRAEMPQLSGDFEALVSESLLAGEALLLVDGLDEIADDSERVGFVKQLRTFLATYPSVSVVVTSRVAGFRAVGGALAHVCDHYRLSDFVDEDIEALTVAWHREVVGRSAATEGDAKRLAEAIIETDRVRRLAENPLLLTTLLLVKRWVGDLPRKRSVLYGKAIEVLLMTWNVEGHKPINQEEAIPQLAYVAYAMSKAGEQVISSQRLRRLLTEARTHLPEILAYAEIPINDFIRRIEDRSSVISLSGHDVENGSLRAMYEFKHLTFQEYLTAVAITEGYLPEGDADREPAVILTEWLDVPAWREIIPLTAVLAGRRAAPIVEVLLGAVDRPGDQATSHLVQCLTDEVQIAPALAERVCSVVGRITLSVSSRALLDSRYGETLAGVVADNYMSGGEHFSEYAWMFSQLACYRAGPATFTSDDASVPSDAGLTVDKWLDAGDDTHLAMAAALAGGAAYVVATSLELPGDSAASPLGPVLPSSDAVSRLVHNASAQSRPVSHMRCFALVWLAATQSVPRHLHRQVLRETFDAWRDACDYETRRIAAWALRRLPLVPRESQPFGDLTPDLRALIEEQADGGHMGIAALVAAYYLREPWSDADLLRLLRASDRDLDEWMQIEAIAEALEASVSTRSSA